MNNLNFRQIKLLKDIYNVLIYQNDIYRTNIVKLSDNPNISEEDLVQNNFSGLIKGLCENFPEIFEDNDEIFFKDLLKLLKETDGLYCTDLDASIENINLEEINHEIYKLDNSLEIRELESLMQREGYLNEED